MSHLHSRFRIAWQFVANRTCVRGTPAWFVPLGQTIRLKPHGARECAAGRLAPSGSRPERGASVASRLHPERRVVVVDPKSKGGDVVISTNWEIASSLPLLAMT